MSPKARFRFSSLFGKDFSVGALLLQVVAVILAIVLGFIVNEWREDNVNKARVDTALRRIAAEVNMNRRLLEPRVMYYDHESNVLDSLLRVYGNKEFPNARIPGWRGLYPPLLSFSSYDVAAASGALEYMDFKQAEDISRAYSVQKIFQQSMDNSISSMINGNLNTLQSKLGVFEILKETSRGLMTYYDSLSVSTLKKYQE